MSNAVLAYPNNVDTSYYDVVFSNGDWTTELPLENLKNRFLANVARTSGVTAADTKFDVDLGVQRGIKVFAIPSSNIQRDGTYQLLATNTVAWSSVAVNANTSPGSATLSVKAGSDGATIAVGDSFQIDTDSTETVYRVTVGATLGALGTGTLTITPVLQESVLNLDTIKCVTGDYTTPLVDTGDVDVWQRVYPFGSLPFGHPSYWDGKLTNEDRAGVPLPLIQVFDAPIYARYWRLVFTDSGNTDGYLEFSRLILAPGWQPTINLSYGNNLGWEDVTPVKTSLGGARFYDVRDKRRVITFTIELIELDEALANGLDMQNRLGISNQLFFVFDPEDTVHLHRRSFLATMRQLQPLEYPYFDLNNVPYILEEVIA